ncbi:MAG: hypothetical protein GEU81_07375 [Nitriliruptorales bacterium]|nr:hypothetical protein [Nitriliruptorales bacterium]
MDTVATNIRQLGQTDLRGHGDCMHVNVQDGYAYVGHMGGDRIGTSIVDVTDPTNPSVVAQLETPPGTHSHKVQVVEDLLVVNHERNPAEPDARSWSAGLKVYDISRPAEPKEVGFLETPGKGVHRMTFMESPYVFMSGSDEGYSDQFLIIADLSDPSNPREVGRWWMPGMHHAGGEQPTWPGNRRHAHHHPLLRGDRAYATWWDAGLFILDMSDLERPAPISYLPFPPEESSCTHSALPLPGRDILIVTDESTKPRCQEVPKRVRVVDISDESAPEVIAKFPVPEGDYCERGGRFGPHNVHEMRPGSFVSSRFVHLTYFNAGLRIFDVEDAAKPKEVASFEPPAYGDAPTIQLNDLTVTADGLIYVTDRAGGGLYILEADLPT